MTREPWERWILGSPTDPNDGAEGGEVNDPDDPGKETKFGITKMSYPNVDVGNITEEDALAIYRRDYWDKNRCGEMPPAVGLALFDAAVNMTYGAGTKQLQLSLYLCGHRDIQVDGVVGPHVIAAAKNTDVRQLVSWQLTRRAVEYEDLCVRYPYKRKWIAGWTRRLFLLGFACKEAM